MTSTSENRKAGGWLANYYLRGLIALAVVFAAFFAGLSNGLPLLLAVIVWVGLWAASRIRANS